MGRKVTLYRIFHGRERPFDQTPEDRARGVSRLKTIGVIVSIIAGLVGAALGIIKLPATVAVAAADAVKTQLDGRYVSKIEYDKAHLDLANDVQRNADEVEKRIDVKLGALKDSIGETNATLRAMLPLINESVGHGRYVTGVLKGASVPDYEPLPRRR